MPKKLSLVDATRQKEDFVKGSQQAGQTAIQKSINTAIRKASNTASAKKKATFNLDADLHQRLKVAAAMHRREMVDMVEEAVREYLDRLAGQ